MKRQSLPAYTASEPSSSSIRSSWLYLANRSDLATDVSHESGSEQQ